MKIKNSIVINKSKEKVWNTTIDFQSWVNWNPNVERIKYEGNEQIKIGSSAIIKQRNMPETKWEIISLNLYHGFSWQCSVYGMQMIATHSLKEDQNGTLNELQFEVKGWLTYLLWPFMRGQIAKNLREENDGLKGFLEKSF